MAEMEAVKWVCLWEGSATDKHGLRKVSGIGSYRDHYDYHRSADVREVTYLAGSPRACFEILRFVKDSAERLGLLTMGSFDMDNRGLRRAAERLGGVCTRLVAEAV
jgi:hypothetical protein